MKRFANRLVVFAASAVVLGTMAYGQTLTADIPFAFHTANASLPAGNYLIDRVAGTGVTNTMRLYNTELRRSVVAVSLPLNMYRAAADKPSLVFGCDGQGCTLRTIKTNNGSYSYPEQHKAGRDHEAVSLIQVPLTVRNGD